MLGMHFSPVISSSDKYNMQLVQTKAKTKLTVIIFTDRVLVTTHETDGHSSQGEEALSLKKNETMPSETISEDAKGNG